MKFYQTVAVLVALLIFAVPGRSPGAALDDLVAEALRVNPEIKASAARWEMFTQKARQAGSLDDPMLMVGIDSGLIRDPFEFRGDPATAKVIGISQMVPFFGKRALAREAATHEAAATRWEVEERKLELAAMVKETWYQLYLVDRSLTILDRSIANLDDLARFTEAMYGVGQIRQADVLRTQVERSKMEEMRLTLRQQRRSLEIGLNTLLARPTVTEVAVVGEVELTPVSVDTAMLERLAEEKRPLLRALAARIDKARTERVLADREFYPDFTLSFEYMQREPSMDDPGDDMYNASLSFNLPVQRERRHAMVAESEAAQRMAAEELNMTRNTIRQAIADLLAQLERDRRMAGLYREGILPQAGAALESALAAYRAGKGEFMQVLDSRMALFKVENDYYKAVAEHQMELARLEATVGAPLPVQ
ncbi:MAG: TolC family protein [Deltaproteobacteria bacterium]|nr:MAG: TolC family protein [Deltaproteobacteria bacterium]